MKKSMLALAALGAFSGLASAQTNVTVYGIVDVGIAHEDRGGAAGSAIRLGSGNLNGSRLGFRGSEDLGGGLSAVFHLENGFSTDTGVLGNGGALFGRNASVGLNGSFGSVKLGRQPTVLWMVSDVFDPFGNSLAGDSSRLFNYSGFRTNNVITYSYEANGFRGHLQYGLGEVAGDASAGRTLAGFGGYRKGPVDFVLTHHRTNDATGNVAGNTTLIAGNYDFGMLKAFLTYAWNKDVTPTGAIQNGADSRNALVGLKAPVGKAGTFMASYMRLTDKAVANADADQWGIGYSHDLSKRTALYTSYSRLSNDAAASYQSSAAGQSTRLFNAGIRHRF